MLFKKNNSLIPFAKLFKMLIILSVSLQLFVVSQMYFFKADIFNDPVLVLIRLFRGTVLSLIAGIILAYPYLSLIRHLNVSFPWKSKPVKRFCIQVPLAIVVGMLITPVILIPAGLVFALEYDFQTIINNSYYMIVLSFFLMAILEAFLYLEESSNAKIKADNFEKELKLKEANNALLEAKAQIEEEKNRAAQTLIEQEKFLNKNLEEEIRKREILVRELDESRSQLASLISNLMGAAYRCQFDESYTMNYISDKIFDISGYPASDFINNAVRTFSSIIHPDDVELCNAEITDAYQNKTPYEFEYRILHNDGNTIWVKENGKCISDIDGKLTYLDGIIVDITRRKEAEIASIESERQVQGFNGLPAPACVRNEPAGRNTAQQQSR